MRDAPVPILATFNLPAMTLFVTFSHPLLNAPTINLASWFIVVAGLLRVPAFGDIVGGIVRIVTGPGAPAAGDDRVTFTPPPFDLISDTTIPMRVEAFTDFLIT